MVKDTQDTKKVLDSIKKQGDVADSYSKLNRTHITVEVPRRMRAIQEMEELLKLLDKRDSEQPKPEQEIKRVEQELDQLRKDTLKLTLVPLKTTEILAVQGFVRDADIVAAESKLGLDVRLFMCLKAEQCSLIWYSARKVKSRIDKYFEKQEDVAMMDEGTLNELSRLYKETFVLPLDERKNS